MKQRILALLTLTISICLTILASACGGGQNSLTAPPSIGPGTVSATNNPLVASYSVTVPANASATFVQFGPGTSYGLRTSAQPTPPGGGTLKFLVAGMRPSTLYHMQAVSQLLDGTAASDSDHTFTTGAIPANLAPSITAAAASGTSPQSGIELIEINPLVATDLNGNVIWYYPTPNGQLTNPAKMLPNGDLLVNYSGVSPDGSDMLLQEIDLAGDVVWQMDSNGLNQALAAAGYNFTVIGSHHDFAVLPNGHLILITSQQQPFTNLTEYPGTTIVTGDILIDLDQNRRPVWTWSEFDHLEINRHPLSFPDWTHTNAVLYSPSDGDLFVSVRNQNWILKIDYSDGQGSGDITWKLGWQGDFTLQGGTDPQDWFYAQHDPSLVGPDSSGTFQMIVFDNGDNRVMDANGDVCGTAIACYSTVPLLQIDETAKTATILSRDNLNPAYSFFGGNAEVLDNGDWEFDICAASFMPSLASIFEVTPDASHHTVWNMQVPGQNAYRAFRLPSLYPGVQW